MQANKRSRDEFESRRSDAGGDRQYPSTRGGSSNTRGMRGGRGFSRGGRGGGRGRGRGAGRGGRGGSRFSSNGGPTKFARGEDDKKFLVLPIFIRRRTIPIVVPTDQNYYVLSAAKLFNFSLYRDSFFGKYYDKSVESYMICEHAMYDQYDANPKTEDDIREQVLKTVKAKFSNILAEAAMNSLQNDNLLQQIKNIKVKVVLGDSLFAKNPPVSSENAVLIQETKEYNEEDLKVILDKGNPRKFFSSVGDGFAKQLMESEYGTKTEKQGISLIFYDRTKKFKDLKDQRLKIKAKIGPVFDDKGFHSLEFKSWNVHTKNFWFRFDIAKPKTMDEVRSDFQKQLSHGARLEIFYERDLTPKEMTPEEKALLEDSLRGVVAKIKYNPTTKTFSNIPMTSDFHFCTYRIKDKSSILNDALDVKCTVTKVHQYENNNTHIRNEITFVDNSLQKLKQGAELLRYFTDPSTVTAEEGVDPSTLDVDKVLEDRYHEIADKAVDKLLRHVLEDCIVQTLQ